MRRKIKHNQVLSKADLVRKAYKSFSRHCSLSISAFNEAAFLWVTNAACDLPKCANTTKIYSFISADDKRHNQSMLYEVVVIVPTKNQRESKTSNSAVRNQLCKCQKHLISN